MSSDSEKIRCLKILAEVGQYILQDKRDPSVVAEVLKDIINVAEPGRPNDPESKEVIRLIKEATTRGNLKWRVKSASEGYDLVSEKPPMRYEVFLSKGFWERSHSVERLRIYYGADYRAISGAGLTKEDQQFFYAVFKQLFQEKEDSPIRAAKKALEDAQLNNVDKIFPE